MPLKVNDLREKPITELTDQEIKGRLHLLQDEQAELNKQAKENGMMIHSLWFEQKRRLGET